MSMGTRRHCLLGKIMESPTVCRFQTSTLLKACSVGPEKRRLQAPPKMAMPLRKGPMGNETSKGTC